MLIKGLPKIKNVRKLTIQGKITRKEYEKLQALREVEIQDDAANYLIRGGHAELVESKKPVKGVKTNG